MAPFLIDLKDTVNISLIKSLQKLELQENKLSQEYTDEYPDLVIIRNQIYIIKDKIRANLENLKASLLIKKKNLERLKLKKEQELKKLPINETSIVNLNRKYRLLLQMNEYLSQKDKENDTIKAAIISDYKIVEWAYLPKRPIKPKRQLIEILSSVFGFVVGLLVSLLRNSISGKFMTIKDIEKYTTVQLYGVISNYQHNNREKRVEIFSNLNSFFTENFRLLRTNLQFAIGSGGSKVVLVTSPLSKEGTSTVVVNLGAILQLAGYKTVIIDLNLHNPSIHKYFDMGVNGSVNRYLAGKCDIDDVIFSTAHPNLETILVGTPPANPSELILSGRIKTMLSKLIKRYDYILIDTPQMGSLTDTFHLMQYSNINLFVFKLNHLRKVYIERLEKIIDRYKLRNIGLVINNVNKDEMKNIYI